jgi:uncharacterized glyoxalase superfamily protein PhnB
LELYVSDVDACVARAVRAGATLLQPVADKFFGDRYAQVMDPFGYVWGIATPREVLTPKEIDARLRTVRLRSA